MALDTVAPLNALELCVGTVRLIITAGYTCQLECLFQVADTAYTHDFSEPTVCIKRLIMCSPTFH
jgi:hypothetical protein